MTVRCACGCKTEAAASDFNRRGVPRCKACAQPLATPNGVRLDNMRKDVFRDILPTFTDRRGKRITPIRNFPPDRPAYVVDPKLKGGLG